MHPPRPFGAVLGTTHGGVRGYSNGGGRRPQDAPHRAAGRYTGLRWQCVELARRYWWHHHGVALPRVGAAADLWRVALPVGARRRRGWARGAPPPPPGSVVVWGRRVGPFGHVAVVVGHGGRAPRRWVCVVEQNRGDRAWTRGRAGAWSRRLAVRPPSRGGRLYDPCDGVDALGWCEPPPGPGPPAPTRC